MDIGLFYGKGRPDTTGVYCERALKELGHNVYTETSDGCSNDLDIALYIDDGYKREPNQELACPSAYWAIDTHVSYERELYTANLVDHVFVAQKPDVERMKSAGIKKVSWLPLGCDPKFHSHKPAVEKLYDIAFIGNIDLSAMFRGRLAFFDKILKKFPNFYFGKADYRNIGKIYKQSRIVLNNSISYDVNMRVFEGMCSGSLLITNKLADLDTLFTSGIPQYTNVDDAIRMIKYYLKDEMARESLAKKLQKEVMDKHTYKDRMKQLIEEVT